MRFWRKFEDRLAAVYIQQKVRGFLHLYNGQEAVLAGTLHAMDLSRDKMITAYRNHEQPRRHILTDVGIAPALLFLFSHLDYFNIGIFQEANSRIISILFTKENTANAALVN